MSKYQKKIILFPAGASGNFLAAFLTAGNTLINPQYRIDLGQTVSSSIFVDPDLDQIKDAVINDNHQTILSHYRNVSDLREFQSRHWLRKIYPCTNLFGWLKNVFYKKQQIEKVDVSQAAMLTQFDFMFENMKHFYFWLKEDTDCPEDLTIDFGKIKNIDYLIDLYVDVNGHRPDASKINFAVDYTNIQGPTVDDCDYLDIEDIVNSINPQDLYDLATLLFIYEKNNNTIDCNRLWTIDDLPVDINHAIEFLIDNSKKYSIFR